MARSIDNIVGLCTLSSILRKGAWEAMATRVTVSGGGPVGLIFASYLKYLLKDAVVIQVYERRAMPSIGNRTVWRGLDDRNYRRQQVVTLQSGQYARLPKPIRDHIFTRGSYSEMWPQGGDSPQQLGYPRNVRLRHLEDTMLELVQSQAIVVHPSAFEPRDFDNADILAICEGSQSETRDHFIDQFGHPDFRMYCVQNEHIEDVVLGLKVKSNLEDSAIVVLTGIQNRYLLNTLNGEGFLNIRLTSDEAKEVVGLGEHGFENCIQSQPCYMIRKAAGGNDYCCPTHGTTFKPPLDGTSFLWKRVREGLKLYDIQESSIESITAFRLSMVQRPRFSAELRQKGRLTAAGFGFLLGDAANALHFWPGRGLNTGIASAVSLARSLATSLGNAGQQLREADFAVHEGVMAMLQHRQKSRAWRAMVTAVEPRRGGPAVVPIKDLIDQGLRDGVAHNRAALTKILLKRVQQLRDRLHGRLRSPPPNDSYFERRFDQLDHQTVGALVASGAWETQRSGGPEVDVDRFLPEPRRP